MAHVILACELPQATDPGLLYKLDASLRALNYVKRVGDPTWFGQFDAIGAETAINTAKTDFVRCAAKVGLLKYLLRIYGSKSPIEAESCLISPATR